MEDRLEFILERWPSVFKEIIKNVMGFDRDHLSEYEAIIVLSFELVGKSVEGLVDFDELLVGLFIACIGLRMVFEGKFSIGGFDFL